MIKHLNQLSASAKRPDIFGHPNDFELDETRINESKACDIQ
jgi:hypothetical protein